MSQVQKLNYNYYSLPISLASFLFEILYNYGTANNCPTLVSQNQETSAGENDQELAFEACVQVLGMKANISEAQHSLLCEGIRRQKGDLALTLLLTYKDTEERLIKIMDKILDRDVYVLFKKCMFLNFNPFNPNFKKIQQQQLQEYIELDLDDQESQQQQPLNTQPQAVAEPPKKE